MAAEPEWAWRRWEYVQSKELGLTIAPDRLEMPTGDTATFTLTVRNRTDKPVRLRFFSGQHADFSVYHAGTEIFRWSQANGLSWRDAPHIIELGAGDNRTYKMAWTARDRCGMPLPQDVYRGVGMLMLTPRRMMSNMAAIRLTPPRRERDAVRVKIDRPFELRVPRQIDGKPVWWKTTYEYNDGRIEQLTSREEGNEWILNFRGLRLGHVVVHLLAYQPLRGVTDAMLRRTWRVEVLKDDPFPPEPPRR